MQLSSKMGSILEVVRTEAVRIDAFMKDDLARLRPEADSLLMDVLEYGLFSGGKRIRPLLVVLASRLCGCREDSAYRLGCAFEYLHAATLFHDDIIDNSPVRRGKPSVYKEFGISAAILAGDFLHALAMATVGELAGRKGLKLFCKATTGMVDGEFMQLRNAQKHNLSELEYYNVIMGKTGLLIAAACEIGGLYAGGDASQQQALKGYGKSLGCAFQIVDDLLDYHGDSRKTGKTVGNDLAEGKITLPLILAMNSASAGDKERLFSILNSEVDRKNCFEEVCALISRYEGFTIARLKAEESVQSALAALSVFDNRNVGLEQSLLQGLALYVLSREK